MSSTNPPAPSAAPSEVSSAVAAAMSGAPVSGAVVRYFRGADGSLLRQESWPPQPPPAGAVEIDEASYRRAQEQVEAAARERQARADQEAERVQRERYRELTGVGLSAELAAALAEYGGERT